MAQNATNEEQTHEYRPGLFTLTTENQITKKVPEKSDVADEPRWIRKLFHFVFIT